MRFGRLSIADDDEGGHKGLPIRLPIMTRKRHTAQDAKENVPPEGDLDNEKARASSKHSRRRTVIDFFKHKGGQKAEEPETQNENILKRMSTQRTNKSNKSKHGRTSSSYNLDVNGLDRILGPSKEQEKRKASDNFFLQQQVRADSRQDSHHIPPFTTGNQSEPDRPLSEEEVFVMFEGAPCFSVLDSESGYRPEVVFHGGSATAGLVSLYSPDFRPLEHETFSTCTLGMHESQESDIMPFASHLRIKAREGNAIMEVPNMLSANGLEPGTVGFESFLQLPTADILAVPDEAATFRNRSLLLSDSAELGLRQYDLARLVKCLNVAGELYQILVEDKTAAGAMAEGYVSSLGESLYVDLLDSADGLTLDENSESISLQGQINALQRVLETKDLWHDFTLVEWRIRIGQLLWTEAIADETSESDGHPSERDVLFLQVTLAAELLLRLKLSEVMNTGISLSERVTRNRKVQWDLILAERFLTNLSVSTLPSVESEDKGVRNSFFSAISFFTTDDSQAAATKPLLQPKNEDKQIAGLMSFASAISWPHAEDVLAQLRPPPDADGNERPVSMVSMYATPLDSPRLFNTENFPGSRLSYFGALARQQQQSRPGMNRTTTAQSIQLRPAKTESDGFNVGGWLSRSWLSGLVMPGEPSSHFLISTLLENSPQAIDALGDNADLYGGFLYGGRTFWSKSSAVGRVLAASADAADCMGWISSPGVPDGQPEGWIDVKVSEYPYPSSQPRIQAFGAVAKSSDPFHNNAASQLRAGDFTLPTDSPPVMGNEVLSHGLSFSTPDTASDSSSDARTTAHLTFSSPINPRLPHISVPLTYDVHFISSYPCHPVPTNKNDSSSQPDSSSDPNALTLHTTYTLDTPPPPAHPLHTSYHFTTLPVASLLAAGVEEARSRALSLPDPQAENDNEEEDEEVTVLDCRGKADLELLARAWCAKVGENAVVGRVERSCLACCVREARGLGVRVVIRV